MRTMRGDKRNWVRAAAALLLLLVAGCSRVASLDVPPSQAADAQQSPATESNAADTPAAAAAPAAPERPHGPSIVGVVRGSIAERLPLTGRVGGAEEASLAFTLTSRADAVVVKPGQTVELGQLLIKAESKDVEKQLDAARARLETASYRLEQAQAQATTQQRDALRRAAADRVQRENAVADAEAGVRSATAELEKLRAGPAPADRQAAQNEVETARA